MAALHQSLNLHVENPNLVTLFAELIAKGVVADNLGQGTPVVELGNLLSEDMERGGRPHEKGSEPTWERLRRVFNIV